VHSDICKCTAAVLTPTMFEVNSDVNLDQSVSLFVKVKRFSVNKVLPCGGELEYLHRSPSSRRRRRKRNAVPGCITGSPCHWGTETWSPSLGFVRKSGDPSL
jgi:hypothetical protein